MLLPPPPRQTVFLIYRTRHSRKRTSGKSDDFKTGIVPYSFQYIALIRRREVKARKKKRSSVGTAADDGSEYSSDTESDDDGVHKSRYFTILFDVLKG